MSHRLRFFPEVAADAVAGSRWHEERSPGLGEDCARMVYARCDEISRSPLACTVVAGRTGAGFSGDSPLPSTTSPQVMRSWWWGCSTALADRLPLRPPWKIAPDAHPTRGRPPPTSWTPCSRPSGATSSSAPTSSSPTICTPCAARATRPSGAASWCAARRASAPTARSCPGSGQGRGPGRRRDGLNAPAPGRPTPNLRRGFEVKSYRE